MSYSVRRTQAQWHVIVDQWHTSELSATQFCQEQSIGYASFCNWRKRFSEAQASLKDSAAPSQEFVAPSFIDLSTLSAGQGSHWNIVLSLGNGVELRLSQS